MFLNFRDQVKKEPPPFLMQQFKVITSHLSGSGGRAHVMGVVPPFPCARRERFPFREAVIWEKSLAGSGYKRVGIRSAYLADRYPYAVCRSESTHGTQDFSPKLRKPEKKLPRPPQRTGTPGKDMLYYTIKMKTLIYIM